MDEPGSEDKMAKFSDEHVQLMWALRHQGLTLKEVADRFQLETGLKVDPKTVLNYTKEPVASMDYIAEPIRHLAIECHGLKLDRRNARRHPDGNLAAIKGSLKTFGQLKPIVVNTRGGQATVIAGNGTLEAARSLGWTHIAAVKVDVSDATAAAFALTDNRTAELAEWDEANLAAILMELEQESVDLAALGMDDEFVRAALANMEAQPVPGEDEWAGALDGLPSGDKAPFQQMTFTLYDDQAQTVKEAVEEAKRMGSFVDTGNENSNGNALARVCEMFLGANR